jgi:hypothetical protein
LAALVIGGAGLWYQSRPSSSAAGRQAEAAAGNEASAALTGAARRAAVATEAGEDESDDGGDRATSAIDPGWQPGEGPMSWDRWLGEFVRPLPGEGLLEYRDRMVPVAQAAIAPQRQRVERAYGSFAEAARLSERDRARIDGIIEQTRGAIMDRVGQAVFGGEFFGPQVRPMHGVRLAHELLDMVVSADRELRDGLSPSGLAALEESRFDLAEYLLIATRWEELIGVPGR